jgi:hypothetical protein
MKAASSTIVLFSGLSGIDCFAGSLLRIYHNRDGEITFEKEASNSEAHERFDFLSNTDLFNCSALI